MDKVIPGMEPTGHYWFNLGKFLQNNGMIPVHVNPHHVKKSKELDDNNPSKNDRKDPKVITGLVKDGRYFRPYIPDGIYAEIRALSGLQVLAQSEITRLKNRIARWFSFYFPNYKDVYGNISAVSGQMVLKTAPLPEDIVKPGVAGCFRTESGAQDYLDVMSYISTGRFAQAYEEMQPEMNVIRAIIDARISQNMTQKELAEKTGIAQTEISRLENGTRNSDTKVFGISSSTSYNQK